MNSSPTVSQVRAARIFGALLVVAGLAASPWVLARFRPAMGPSMRILILLFDLSILFLGACLLGTKRKALWFRAALAPLFMAAILTVALGAVELYLARSSSDHRTSPYEPFAVQHLHPFYYFSFPRDEREIARINNAVVSITPQGFRGPGPEFKGDRKLAFLIGGSAAFGQGASSNQTTVSGYLNSLQTVYHVVNAAVPSWNSTQEFYRVSLELLRYQPALILAYNGFNDAASNSHYRDAGLRVPPGTPESFEQLARRVDDIRAQAESPLFNPRRLGPFTFPRTRSLLDARWRGRASKARLFDFSEEVLAGVEEDADSYLWNSENMTRLAASRGTRVVVFWQAIINQHRRVSPEDIRSLDDSGSPVFTEYLKRFHQHVFTRHAPGLEIVDLGDVFDRHFEAVPAREVFVDEIHLTSRGYQIVAREMLSRIMDSAPSGH